MFNSLSALKNSRKKRKLHIKKNLSTLTFSTRSQNKIFNITSDTNTKNTNQKTPISLFLERNPYHYKLPLTKKEKGNFKVLGEKNFFNKRLMDSIENFSNNKKLNSEQYNTRISDLMTKYIYSNPDIDNNNDTNYELTRTKIKFYNERKKTIQNILKKSRSVFKNNTNDSKYDDGDSEKGASVNVIDAEYKDPIDSLGLVLRNKIVHDKILLNYQDRQVQDYGKHIKFYKSITQNENMSKKVKITSIIPSIFDGNNFFKPNLMGSFSDNDKIINPSETKQYNNNSKYSNRIMEKAMFLEMSDFIKGSVYLLSHYFRPSYFFPESREEFCMDIDAMNKTIYLFSGNSSYISAHQLWKFDLMTNNWTNIESNYNPEPRRGHTGVLYKNKYYIFGGKYLNSNFLAKLDIFDFNLNSWSSNNYNYFLFKQRRNHIACLIGSQMLIHGGVDENGEILDDSYLLNLNNNLIWSKTSIMPILIPPKLAYHSCCLVITSDILYNNKFTIYRIPNSFIAKKINSRIKEMGMYVFGGKNKTICNDMWLLKIGKKPLEWEKVLAFGEPPCPRYLCSMNFFEKGNFIIIHGGKTRINEGSFALNDTYLFELYRYQWLRVDYGDKASSVKKRCSHCSVVCENKLFIFGGINDGVFNGSKFFVINLDINKAKSNVIKMSKFMK